MKLITGKDLRDFCQVHVENFDNNLVEHEALVIRLHKFADVEHEDPIKPTAIVVPSERQMPQFREVSLASSFSLRPGQYLLARSIEEFNMPRDCVGLFTLRSWYARAGLEQASSLILKPGWESNGAGLALELRNILQNHVMLLKAGDPIGQIIFWRI